VNLERLEEILELISETHVLVAGDFFLDQYWLVDPALEEISLETDLPAHQVSDTRLRPGAAGTVANNLAALGVGQVDALGVIGDDGNGVELLKGLEAKGVRTADLVVTSERRTPVYTKPLALPTQREMERFDIERALRPFEDELLEWSYRQMVSTCQEHGITPVWVLLPMTTSRLQQKDIARDVATAETSGFSVITLENVYAGKNPTDLVIAPWDNHPNASAHQLVAEQLYQGLIKQPDLVMNP